MTLIKPCDLSVFLFQYTHRYSSGVPDLWFGSTLLTHKKDSVMSAGRTHISGSKAKDFALTAGQIPCISIHSFSRSHEDKMRHTSEHEKCMYRKNVPSDVKLDRMVNMRE